MADEVGRALGIEGGGFEVQVRDREGMVDLLVERGEDREKLTALDDDGNLKVDTPTLCAMLGDDKLERTWILSDLSKGLQSRHVAYVKGRLRQGLLDQKEQGIINQAALDEEIKKLNHHFEFGTYSFGQKDWYEVLTFSDVLAKLYQLLLEEKQADVAEWSLDDVAVLIRMNEKGFGLALEDVLPKALAKLGKEAEKTRAMARARVTKCFRSSKSVRS